MARVKKCFYCGKEGKRAKEDIVPKAIGGTLTIDCVCETCNNGRLSILDKELISKSPVAIIAAMDLDKRMEYTWDIDHDEKNVLLEAEQNKSSDSMFLWPQLIFTDDGAQLRGDWDEVELFGRDNFGHQFHRYLRAAFHNYNIGEKKGTKLWFEEINSILDQYNFPPRVFARRRIQDFGNGMTFQCRYSTHSDRKKLLRGIKDWSYTSQRNIRQGIGSLFPSTKFFFDAQQVLRSLTKLGLNLLVHVYPNIAGKERESVIDAITFVVSDTAITDSFLNRCGFVNKDQLKCLNCPEGAHKFRLLFDDLCNKWYLYCAFFSGKISAVVHFSGSNSENWRTVNITVPIGDDDWIIKRTKLFLPISTIVTWDDLTKIIPSPHIFNTKTTLTKIVF